MANLAVTQPGHQPHKAKPGAASAAPGCKRDLSLAGAPASTTAREDVAHIWDRSAPLVEAALTGSAP